MKNSVVAFAIGLLFAVGLGLGGMTQPGKIVGFLDLFGDWDPSLIFVMIGAIAVHSLAYFFIRNRSAPILAKKWNLPTKKEITPSLVIGSFIFGVGWALGGFCPGPGLVSLASFEATPFIFVASMIAGMFLFRFLDKRIPFRK